MVTLDDGTMCFLMYKVAEWSAQASSPTEKCALIITFVVNAAVSCSIHVAFVELSLVGETDMWIWLRHCFLPGTFDFGSILLALLLLENRWRTRRRHAGACRQCR
jgi:hypothetical protein